MIKFLSLFSGIGAFEKALSRQGIEYELVNYCEVDKFASKSYSAVHGVPESMNLGDITKVDESKLPDVDMITYGFPCQDISLVGKQKGLFNDDGTYTRSGLFFEALRIIEAKKPIYAIAENVKNLTSKNFKEQFEIMLNSLENAGYNNYWKVLNAKDYGIPQNRERVFIVSIRKDTDKHTFEFPKPFALKLKLKDLLEIEVDKKYYLSDKAVKFVTAPPKCGRGVDKSINKDVCQTITARGQATWRGTFVSDDIDHLERTSCIGGIEPVKIVMKNGDVYMNDGNNTLPAFNIRKLTPKECWRLMGFDDEDFEKAQAVCSDRQLYKQAGNSIVVNVLEYIFNCMFDEKQERQTNLIEMIGGE